MTIEQVGIMFSLANGSLSLLGVVYLVFVKFAKIEFRVEQLWEFNDVLWQLRVQAGKAEIVKTGRGRMNSPIVIDDEAKALFEPFHDELRELMVQRGLAMTDCALTAAVAKQFGERFTEQVGIPVGLSPDACVVIAVEIAKSFKPQG